MGDGAGPAINARHVSRGCAFGDFDNDGDLDIVIMNQHEPPSLLRNDAPKENHWIKVRLEGTKEQSQRDWRACACSLRRQDAGAGGA